MSKHFDILSETKHRNLFHFDPDLRFKVRNTERDMERIIWNRKRDFFPPYVEMKSFINFTDFLILKNEV